MGQLRIDFAMNRGHEMMIDKEGGIARSELDELELQILRAQQVPYLLPMDWYEVDGKVSFRYSLAGMKMLAHRLQQEPLTMEQYYGLLLAVTDAILECKDYMLRPETCLLNEQFLFIGDRLTDIRMAYMPLKQPWSHDQSLPDSLLSLAVRWTTYIETIDGVGLKRLLQRLSHSRSPLADLRETLLELIAGACPAVLPQEEAHREADGDVVQSGIRGSRLDALSMVSVTAEDVYDGHEAEPSVPSDKRRLSGRWGMIAAGALVVACVWRFLYVSDPSQTNLLLSAALTLLVAAGLLMLSRRSSALFLDNKSIMAAHEDDMELYSGPLPAAKKAWRAEYGGERSLSSFITPGTTTSMGNYALSPPAGAGGERSRHAAETAVLEAKEQAGEASTILLSEARWLSRMWNGQEEKITLDAEVFKIGRSGDGVSYSDPAEGISRLHLEIEQIGDEHHAKDLGSRNGSLLNGKLMVPYKAYKLELGDRIHLAGDKGPLYELRAG
ncbi:DUF6382 domain-containing protein [Paenibacillus sp. PL2-23]|uniref:DUF6382 domain-containing protein n=1 Tax=Paenibacillus sp. PL2-23 TaxID=2100729 RepID=UPI0030F6B8E2